MCMGIRMIFRRTIFSSLFVGLLAGLILSLFQVLTINPIIFEAESFEIEQAHDHASHDHSEGMWAPSDGIERTVYTVMANAAAGIAFSAILLSLMSQLQLQRVTRLSLIKGAGWGVAGFLVFFVAPGIGLPPEIPGVDAQAIEHRQVWWLLAVISAAAGLLLIAFTPVKFKVAGAVALALPYLIAAPRHEGATFLHPDAEVVATLTRLHHDFIITSGIGSLAFWLVLGVISAWVLNSWILSESNTLDDRDGPA